MQIDLQFIVLLTTFLIATGAIIWKIALIHHDCLTNKDTSKRAHERIDKLEGIQNDKIEELSKQINYMKEAQIRMEEKLNTLIDIEKKKSRRAIK